MGKFDGWLICTDLDGTFAEGTEICGDNARYVKYFQENGGLFTAVTGRLSNHIKKFEAFTPNCPVITCNGAMIYDMEKEQVLYKKPLPDTASELVEFVKDFKGIKAAVFNTAEGSVPVSDVDMQNSSAEFFKLVLVAEDEESATALRNKLYAEFGEKYSIFLGWSRGVECLAKGANKGTAVEKLREILSGRANKIVCVGDSESDTFMLRCADIGYAVENASKDAKQAADRVTVHYKKGAIAQIIKDIEG